MDDAFALGFLLKAIPAKISAIYSVNGNAAADACHLNNRELMQLLKHNTLCFNGNSISTLPRPLENSEYLALGPLTNLAHLIQQGFRPQHIWMTLGRLHTRGSWPPYWPMEFNVTKDLAAFQTVLSAEFPITIVPLDVASKLRFDWKMKKEFTSSFIGQYLWKNSFHWRWRNLILKGNKSFPVWDLVSAMCLVHPEIATIKNGVAHLFKNGLVLCDVEGKPQTIHKRKNAVVSRHVAIVTNINASLMWDLFFKALQSP